MTPSHYFLQWWGNLTKIKTNNPAQFRRGQLLLLFLSLCLAMLVQMTLNNILIQLNTPSDTNLLYLIEDLISFIPFFFLWNMTQKGQIQRSAHISFSAIIIAAVLVSDVQYLEYLMVVFALPVGISSFVIRPSSSFIYATLTTLAYTFVTLINSYVWDYSLTAVLALYSLAFLTWITAHQLEDALHTNETLVRNLQISNHELNEAYETTIEGWSRALEFRDRETEGHTLRVTDLAVKISRRMGFSEEAILHIRRGALLHDMGKLGIPDEILRKPEPLTEGEMQIMRLHPQIAVDLLTPIEYLKPALVIPRYHHEKWDGTGYPHGLKGEEIPLEARIFAIIDVYDALSHDRPYRKAWDKPKVLNYLKAESGKHFDPDVVGVFIHEIESESNPAG